MNYKLELKQIVEFPRCRIYRDFIQTLITTKSIRTTGGSFLFYYLVLLSSRQKPPGQIQNIRLAQRQYRIGIQLSL